MSRRAALLALLLLAACGRARQASPDATAPEASPPESISWASERSWGEGGPLIYTLRLERVHLDLSQEVRVEEQLSLSPGVSADFPDILPGDLDGLALVRVKDLPTTQSGQTTIRRRRLLLEPERSGKVAIAERWVFYRDAAQQPDDKQQDSEHVLRSDRLTLQVDPLPQDLVLTLPAGPGIFTEDPSPPPAARWTWLVAAGVALLALGGLVLLRRSRPAPPPRPAHELALEALARLDALDLLAKGDLEGQFVFLSAILRDYVEARFGVRAPERTTQEFLREVREAPALEEHRPLLETFLGQADAVKFARQRPPLEEARAARETVQQFVETTRLDAPALVLAGEGAA